MIARFKNLKIIKDIFPFLWTKQEKIRFLFLITLGLVFVSILLDLSIPLVLKKVVSKFLSQDKGMTYQFSILLLAYGMIWTLSQSIQQVRLIVMVKPLEKCIRLFCSNLFDNLHSLPMKFHFDRKTGSITNALERAQYGLADVFWGIFLFIIPTIVEVILAAIILSYYYGVIYGLILVGIATVFIVYMAYATEWTTNLQTLSNDQNAKTNANIVDSLLNFSSVKYFNRKEYELVKCDNDLKEREQLLIKTIRSMEFVRIGQVLIIGAGLVLLIFMAGQQGLVVGYDASDFILINGYVLQFAVPLNHMGFIARDIRRGLNDLSHIMEIYNPKSLNSLNTVKHTSRNELKSIKFENVFFGYEPSASILKDVSFEIQAGQTVGIVGSTGSGKSTISNLLYKFYQINSGEIFINNENINNIHSEIISEYIGIVPQDITLFNTSIYENILFANPSASKRQIEEAIELAHLEPVLKKLPKHYNTVVGERGLKLSGGEKQRIALARVLLKRPSLYIFDEATSSLDVTTEKIIMKKISPILEKATSIIIAHRLSTVVTADEILVLNNGMIEERGTHWSLLNKKGFYASLWHTHIETGL
jgi:ABC-type transport system involved in Fe-S cluster assembly fused permease/ATPase subunit